LRCVQIDCGDIKAFALHITRIYYVSFIFVLSIRLQCCRCCWNSSHYKTYYV